MSEKYDVVVLGATGYTGKLVCDYLQHRAKETGQTWAVAGRRKDALEAVAAQYGAGGILVCDCLKAEDCTALAEACKAVCNIAGPYYERAEGVVGACAKAGTHYLDLTGELIFVRGLIDNFHDMAAASGAKIAPIAGYEALPFDLMALALLEAYMNKYSESPASIDLMVGMGQPPEGVKGMDQMISGGTAQTMREMLMKDFSNLSADPTALNADDDPNRDAIRAAMPYRLRPRKDDLERWTMPIFPGPFLHPAVVNRTFSVLRQKQKPVSTAIRYRERMSMGGGGGALKAIGAYAIAGMGRVMGWLLSTTWMAPRRMAKRYMDKNGPQPGDGPDLAHIDDWRWSLRGVARGPEGALEMSLEGDGHPGYRTTANMIGEAALILADGDANTPDNAGVITPASALGAQELARFASAGMKFSEVAESRAAA